ncbi:hypothetical protein F2Q70_00023674 [Brassica cretica]|uniref:Uncharacterized protein n=1 Tax=Brassica cretica TaxID=69181 RepID=A0A8S9GHN6_BRACR|nr:hypothetical protein F2Q70_00023674 [Brassica cretica]
MDPVFTTPPSKLWLENGLTVDPFQVEALQNPCHRLTSKLPSLIHLTNPNLDITKFEVMEMPMIWIEREAQRALNLMLEKKKKIEIPEKQRMERQESVARVPAIMCTFAIVS